MCRRIKAVDRLRDIPVIMVTAMTNAELSRALQEVKVLRGFIPICISCKNICDDKGFWQQFESYIQKRSEALFSHGVCPDCYQILSDKYLSG